MRWDSAQPWSTYALHLSSFNPPALIMDPLLGYSLFRAIQASGPDSYFPSMSTSLLLFLLWVAFTKTVKSVGHFRQYPADLKFLPLLYVFSYLHSFIFLYSLFTLHKVSHSQP